MDQSPPASGHSTIIVSQSATHAAVAPQAFTTAFTVGRSESCDVVVSDDYFLDRAEMIPDEKGELDFEAPEAVDIEKFNKHLNALLSGKEVDIPRFDFIEGKKIFGERISRIYGENSLCIRQYADHLRFNKMICDERHNFIK